MVDSDDTGQSAAQALTSLAGEFIDLARAMAADEPDEGLSIDIVLRFAVHAVAGTEDASVTRVTNHSVPRTIAATSELPRELDDIQYSLGQGPLAHALDQSDIVIANDLAADDRWPDFADAAGKAGVGSMLSFRLFLTEDERGALNFYSRKVDAFDAVAISTGAIFSAYASLTMMNLVHRDTNMNLKRALESNREIGTAMGILMAQNLYTPDQAFDALREASGRLHRRLHTVAEEVIETGQLPVTSDQTGWGRGR